MLAVENANINSVVFCSDAGGMEAGAGHSETKGLSQLGPGAVCLTEIQPGTRHLLGNSPPTAAHQGSVGGPDGDDFFVSTRQVTKKERLQAWRGSQAVC